jgi:hypothetical protein
MVQENARKLAEQQGRDLAAAQGNLALETLNSQTNAARYAGSEETLRDEQVLRSLQAQAAMNRAKAGVVESESQLAQGQQAAVASSVEGNFNLTSRVNNLTGMAESLANRAVMATERGKQTVTEFVGQARAVMAEAARMTREQRNALRMQLGAALPKMGSTSDNVRRAVLEGTIIGPEGESLAQQVDQILAELRRFVIAND